MCHAAHASAPPGRGARPAGHGHATQQSPEEGGGERLWHGQRLPQEAAAGLGSPAVSRAAPGAGHTPAPTLAAEQAAAALWTMETWPQPPLAPLGPAALRPAEPPPSRPPWPSLQVPSSTERGTLRNMGSCNQTPKSSCEQPALSTAEPALCPGPQPCQDLGPCASLSDCSRGLLLAPVPKALSRAEAPRGIQVPDPSLLLLQPPTSQGRCSTACTSPMR